MSNIKMKLSESFEDYLEIIYVLDKENRSVRTKDIAKKLDVTSPSVNEAIKKLDKKGYVIYERYGKIKLTKKGCEKAKKIYKKHSFLLDFLINEIGVEKEMALKEACKIEHILSKKTFGKFLKYAKKKGGG